MRKVSKSSPASSLISSKHFLFFNDYLDKAAMLCPLPGKKL